MYTCTSICTSPTHVHAQQHLLNLRFKRPFSGVKKLSYSLTSQMFWLYLKYQYHVKRCEKMNYQRGSRLTEQTLSSMALLIRKMVAFSRLRHSSFPDTLLSWTCLYTASKASSLQDHVLLYALDTYKTELYEVHVIMKHQYLYSICG